ncbi:hypothetical protein B0T20DRAFT_145473 [Sordaria brevicollis]|uniref:NACHT domain-containing protein n=1 Tax=Sordaria brevicollis TaxID=83679 RepID=A0AAE0UDT0_SORBR|nr:hypothetical protein B0T20DRAFT_145473 [Sordaria brevicollis]
MVRAQGISLLFEPTDVKPELDIVFIHGFTGHPRTTWAMDKKKAEKRRKAHNDVHNGGKPAEVYWPKDLLPTTLPCARVMTFGYDTKIRHFSQGQISKNTVQDHAQELLEQLRDKRPSDAKASRPLVFIAHSLGGLVVREALTLASHHQQDQNSTDRYDDIFRSTAAVMFFGTPHRGADPRSSLHRILSASAMWLGVDVNAHIVDALMPNVNNLKKQLSLDDFKTLAAQRSWAVYTFQEEYGVSGLFSRKVVEDHSSRLGPPVNETPRRISDNHMDMCRFYGLSDSEYEKVAGCLQEILKTIRQPSSSLTQRPTPANQTQTIRITLEEYSFAPAHVGDPRKALAQRRDQREKSTSTLQEPTAPSPQPDTTPPAASVTSPSHELEEKEDLRRRLVQSLKFDRLGARSMDIEATYADTCQWFLSKQEYVDWQRPGKHSPSSWFLWIKGKPGTGKSTLMKYLHSTRQPEGSTSIVLPFFFNARGAQLEHTTIGCYRGLLFALLDGRQELWPSLDHLGKTGSEYVLKGNWTVAALTQTLTQAIRMTHGRAIEIWIDALDECGEDEVRKMVSFFEGLMDMADTQDMDLKICFSSRHYPSVTSPKAVDVVLEQQQKHDEDIARYIEAKLHIGTAETEEIKAELLRKCSGIFLWVVLVVDMLNREYARGNVLNLRGRLDEIPSDLHAVFEKVLTDGEGDTEELILFFQLLLYARQHLEPAELFMAIQRAKEPQSPLTWTSWKPPMSLEALQRWVNSSSRGLAQVTRPVDEDGNFIPYKYYARVHEKKPTVQFIHESVRDYLLGKSANKYTWSGLSKLGDMEAHRVWVKVCLDQILAIDISIDDYLLHIRHPLVAYATAQLPRHMLGMLLYGERTNTNPPTQQDKTNRGYVFAQKYFRSFFGYAEVDPAEYSWTIKLHKALPAERFAYLRRILDTDCPESKKKRELAIEKEFGGPDEMLIFGYVKAVASRSEWGVILLQRIYRRGEIWEDFKNTTEDPDVVIRRIRDADEGCVLHLK